MDNKFDCKCRYYGTGGGEVLGDFSGKIDTTGKVFVRGNVNECASIKNTGGVIIEGSLYGRISTTGEVIVMGDMKKGSYISNTGGGEVHGVLDGKFDTTGDIKVYGSLGPNALISGGRAIVYQKVKRMVTETYSVPATRLVEREFWEPMR